MAKKGGLTVGTVKKLAEPIAQQLGLKIWDVRFVKEGATWYLRIFIDRDSGVTIEDCENMSRAIDKPLDELDPIEQSYFLEVSSPGIERELRTAEHFKMMAGRDVVLTLYTANENGEREIIAELVDLIENNIVLKDLDGTEFSVDKKLTSSVNLYEPIDMNMTDDLEEENNG